MSRIDLIATAAFGLESQVAFELKKMGYEDQATEAGRVTFRADEAAIARANLWLRSSDRVLLRLGDFPARTFDELFDGVRALPWADWLPVDACFPVDGKSVKSQLTSVPAVQSITKKAIVEALAARYQRDQLPETGPRFKVLVSVLEDRATLTLDTSGDGLHKRGYRQLGASAPIKETLAAALIGFSRWHPDRPFADPLCGSGTLPLEAAMIGLNIAPGLARHFDAERWPALDPAIWREARKEALDSRRMGQPLAVFGSDIDVSVIEMARFHAKSLGIADRVTFESRPVRDFKPKGDYGVLLTNPPYGERLGEVRQIERIYAELGVALAHNPTWSAYVITAYEGFERCFGKVASKKRKLYNGPLRCDLYQYFGPRPPRVAPTEIV